MRDGADEIAAGRSRPRGRQPVDRQARGGQPVDRQPALVLAGAGLTASVALRITDVLAPRFSIVGAPLPVKASSQAPAPPTIESALALLDAAQADQAHIVGLSTGGLVAQELAIRHPSRVRTLVLGSTSAGGRLDVPPEPPVRDFLRCLADLPVEEGLWAAVPYLYAADTRHRHARRIGEDIARRLRHPLESRWLQPHRPAGHAGETRARLASIVAPALVIHGEQDRITPVENAHRLADSLGQAQLITLADGAHAFPTDVPAASDEIVSFLLAHSRPHSRRQPRPAARRTGRANRA
jgi:pimeloyl-ACP methyl ester carboxylesterase